MAYEARRNDDDDELTKKEKFDRDSANNAQNIRNAADVAIATGEPHAAAIGGAVKAADKLTGGASSELLGKGLTALNRARPLGDVTQSGLNALNESGVGDVAGKVASFKGGTNGDVKKPDAPKTPNQVKTPANSGGEQNSSLPSSDNKNNIPSQKGNEDLKNKQHANDEEKNSTNKEKNDKKDLDDAKDRDKDKDKDSKSDFSLFGIKGFTPIVLLVTPALLVLMFAIVLLAVISNFADYEDAFGISGVTGADTGGMDSYVSDPNQSAFYDRIVEVRNEFQEDGKTIDPLMIVSVYHALNLYDANISYGDMTKSKITQIANAMFEEDSNIYNETIFKENLKEKIIPIYLPNSSSNTRDAIINEIFEYIERYYSLIGKKSSSNCSSGGTCTYDINGFWISDKKGNINKSLTIDNLYVRLMQCGAYNNHDLGGQWGQPLAGEELVPFEKYILGVAYAEIGPGAPEHAFKAQMIAARNFAIARSFQMQGWRTIREENGKMILQVASCTADQVYCDPDRGCSATSGQWGEVHSGPGHGSYHKDPIPSDSLLRTYANETQGELLVNTNGNVILTPYASHESNLFTSLARSGLDYKQILIQVYNQKLSSSHVNNIYKANCGSCNSTGEYASWKQYEGEWTGVEIGNSGKTIKQIGCLVTSISMQIERSGVQTNVNNFNPGTFVNYLNSQGAFSSSGALNSYASVEKVAPAFKYQSYIDVSGMNKQEKLNTISSIVNQQGVYAVAEVKGNTGQHWVAIDSVNGNTINMMDPGSSATDMWSQYNWANTSRIVYYKVG